VQARTAAAAAFCAATYVSVAAVVCYAAARRLRKAVKQLLQEAHAATQSAGQALDASLAAKLGSTKMLKDELAAQVRCIPVSVWWAVPVLLLWWSVPVLLLCQCCCCGGLCQCCRDAQYAHFGSVLRTSTRTGRSTQPIRC
jgi:hypothetical protein